MRIGAETSLEGKNIKEQKFRQGFQRVSSAGAT